MEAIERNFLSNDLITLTFLTGLILLFLMKVYKPKRLLGYSVAFFTQGFIEKRAEKNTSIFSSPFHGLLFTFTILTISTTIFTLTPSYFTEKNVFSFLIMIGLISLYLAIKFFLNYFIISVFTSF